MQDRRVESKHPSRKIEKDQEESEGGQEERIIYPLIETGTGLEDIQSDKSPRSAPYSKDSHALTAGTGWEDIQPYKVPRSDPYNKESNVLTTRDGSECAPWIHPSKREGHDLTKMLVQMRQEVAKRKAAWPEVLQRATTEVLGMPCVKPETPKFKFDMTKEATKKNFCILAKNKTDLVRAIQAQQKSPLGYGSEF